MIKVKIVGNEGKYLFQNEVFKREFYFELFVKYTVLFFDC